MTWSRSPWVAGFAAVAGLAGLADAQAYFGLDQTVSCAAYPNFVNLGCFAGDIREANSLLFQPENFNPATDPSSDFPGYWPGTVFNNTVTPGNCARVCRGFGFRVAALVDNECSCGYTVPSGSGSSGLCTVPCAGDSSQTCGGATGLLTVATQILIDPSFAAPQVIAQTPSTTLSSYYKYLGCFNIAPGQEFPTDNRPNSALVQISGDACLAHCATQGYPLAYASYAGPNSVNCECGETFAAGTYRVDEALDTTGICRSSCSTGGLAAVTDCDTDTCCGQAANNMYSVYINPELQGCFVPSIPGYGKVNANGVATAYACASVAATLTGGPSTLARTVYGSPTVNAYAPQPTHALSVVGANNEATYFEYGCFPFAVVGDVLGGAAGPAPLAAGSITLQNCADSCIGFQFFALTGGNACYCGASVTPGTSDPMASCNVKCAGNAGQLCGGLGELEVFAQLQSWTNDVAAQLRVTVVSAAYPTSSCSATTTSTATLTTATTGTTTTTATSGSSTGTGTDSTGTATTGTDSTGTATTGTDSTGTATTGTDSTGTATTGTDSTGTATTGTDSTGTATTGTDSTGTATTGTDSTGTATTGTDSTGTATTGTDSTGTATTGTDSTGTATTGTDSTGTATTGTDSTGTATTGTESTGTATTGTESTGTATTGTETSTSSTTSATPSTPPAGSRFIFGVTPLDGATAPGTFAKGRRNIKRQAKVGGFVGNAGPGRAAHANSKRQGDGFLGGAGPLNPTDCTLATPFEFGGDLGTDGTLSSGGELLSTDVGVAYEPFYTNPTPGAITTTFSVLNDVLVWSNPAFANTNADFCQDVYGQVWIIFDGTTTPFACTPVILTVYAVTECVDGTIISITTAEPTLTSTSTSTASTDVSTTTAVSTTTDATGVSTTTTGSTTTAAPVVIDGTLTLGDHTYAFPATLTAGDYGCFTENATWVEGQTAPTLFAGAI